MRHGLNPLSFYIGEDGHQKKQELRPNLIMDIPAKTGEHALIN